MAFIIYLYRVIIFCVDHFYRFLHAFIGSKRRYYPFYGASKTLHLDDMRESRLYFSHNKIDWSNDCYTSRGNHRIAYGPYNSTLKNHLAHISVFCIQRFLLLSNIGFIICNDRDCCLYIIHYIRLLLEPYRFYCFNGTGGIVFMSVENIKEKLILYDTYSYYH